MYNKFKLNLVLTSISLLVLTTIINILTIFGFNLIFSLAFTCILLISLFFKNTFKQFC